MDMRRAAPLEFNAIDGGTRRKHAKERDSKPMHDFLKIVHDRRGGGINPWQGKSNTHTNLSQHFLREKKETKAQTA